jgi:hypothetical protein
MHHTSLKVVNTGAHIKQPGVMSKKLAMARPANAEPQRLSSQLVRFILVEVCLV